MRIFTLEKEDEKVQIPAFVRSGLIILNFLREIHYQIAMCFCIETRCFDLSHYCSVYLTLGE